MIMRHEEMIALAEAQLAGYIQAKQGYSIESLVDGMDLHVDEYFEILKRGIVSIPESIQEDIDTYFQVEDAKEQSDDRT